MVTARTMQWMSRGIWQEISRFGWIEVNERDGRKKEEKRERDREGERERERESDGKKRIRNVMLDGGCSGGETNAVLLVRTLHRPILMGTAGTRKSDSVSGYTNDTLYLYNYSSALIHVALNPFKFMDIYFTLYSSLYHHPHIIIIHLIWFHSPYKHIIPYTVIPIPVARQRNRPLARRTHNIWAAVVDPPHLSINQSIISWPWSYYHLLLPSFIPTGYRCRPD